MDGSRPAGPRKPQRFIVYDEAWRTLREPSLLARMQSQWKLARALGISNMMIIHALSDLDAVGEANSQSRNLALGLLRDCSTKVIYAQEPDQIDRTCTGLGLSPAEGAELLRLVRGEALWRVGQQRSFIVNHRITDGPGSERELFDTNARMLDKADRFPASREPTTQESERKPKPSISPNVNRGDTPLFHPSRVRPAKGPSESDLLIEEDPGAVVVQSRAR
jgi:hypothetical protein